MLCGTSGVGKTETALALAEALYGGEQNVITINMSEFQEAHTVSSLKGAPPGYVGYGEGGILTEAVRRRPYSVVLLDEVEKAHPRRARAVLPGLRQGPHGRRRRPDDRLQEHDHPADVERRLRADHEHVQGPGAAARSRSRWPPRCTSRCRRSSRRRCSAGWSRSRTTRCPTRCSGRSSGCSSTASRSASPRTTRSRSSYSDDAVKLIVKRCNNAESGGRIIDSILTNTVLPKVSIEYLSRARRRAASSRRCAWASPTTISPTPSSKANPPENRHGPAGRRRQQYATLSIKAEEGDSRARA